MTRDEVFAELARRGFTRVEVHFSGGNDEGGADDFTGFLADDRTVDLHVDWYEQPFVASAGRQAYFENGAPVPNGTRVVPLNDKAISVNGRPVQPVRPAIPEDELAAQLMYALEEPIDDR